MSKRVGYLTTYLFVMFALTVLRIAVNVEIFGELGEWELDLVFTSFAQLLCMGIIPILGIVLLSKKHDYDYDCLGELKERLSIKKPNKKIWLPALILIILHPIINGGVSTVWSNFICWTGYTPVISDPTVYAGIEYLSLGILLTAVLPAIFEEITHRGLVLQSCGGNTHKRVLLSALLFALMHQNIMQTGYTFVGGLLMGYITVFSGSIFPAVLMHAFNNLLVVVRGYSASINGIVYQIYKGINAFGSTLFGSIVLSLIWALAVGLTMYIFYKWEKKTTVEFPSVVENGEREEKVLSKVLWVAIIVFGAVTTLFTYVWGLMR